MTANDSMNTGVNTSTGGNTNMNVNADAWGHRPKAVVGLGYGDEGKGMTVAALAHDAMRDHGQAVVVRYNGGPQAAHNVRKYDPKTGHVLHHTFSQFGAGTLEGAATILSATTLVQPYLLMHEAGELLNLTGFSPVRSLDLDPKAPLLLPIHSQLNRALEERRGRKRHGSTGMGVGAARDYELTMNEQGQGDAVPRVADMADPFALRDKLMAQAAWLEHRWGLDFGYDDALAREQASQIHLIYGDLMAGGCVFEDTGHALSEDFRWTPQDVVFEGSQGIMLDLRYGFFPHVTYGWLDAANAVDQSLKGNLPVPIVVGVTRTYATRHGYGPFPQEGTKPVPYAGEDNATGVWQGAFREGLLDVPTLSYAAGIVHPDVVAVSCEDLYGQTGEKIIDRWDGEDGQPISIGDYALSADDSIRREDNDRDFDPATVYAPLLAAKPHTIHADLERLERIVEDTCHAPIAVRGEGDTVERWRIDRTIPFDPDDDTHRRQAAADANTVGAHERSGTSR